nr:MMPL family transporter [Gracilibacillus halotolerans]
MLTFLAPGAREYEVSRLEPFPDDMQSVVAQDKLEEYFESNDGIPAIVVMQAKDGELTPEEFALAFEKISEENINGLNQIVPIDQIPIQALQGFFSEDSTTATLPMNFDESLDTGEIDESIEHLYDVIEEHTNIEIQVTGPAGISVDTKNLFTQADVVLILATVGIILILLIVIYRSPALALIPLLAAGVVYQVVNQLLGVVGKVAGVQMGTQALSIMSILLFAAVVDYSLFVFSRYREELRKQESKHEAMKQAMHGVGLPVFFSGSTVLAAMLILFFANFGDTNNFAPLFSVTMVVVTIASVTFVPAIFTIFGRKSFWPLIPKVGESETKPNAFWSRVGRFVSKKPALSVIIVGAFLLISALNIFQIDYEFDTLKSFPEDMPSRVGYEILEDKFQPGDLAQTTVLIEANDEMTEDQINKIVDILVDEDMVANVQQSQVTDDFQAASLLLTFEVNPYALEAMDSLENMIEQSDSILEDAGIEGSLYFAGETAGAVDDRTVNNRDLMIIIILETLLIFFMLIFLTKSIRMPLYMMATIVISFVAALGLGMFLVDLLFDIENMNNRVPLYAFVFLVALGIDYNIMLVSRYLEERKHLNVREAVASAVAHTGGVISSAGLILAATFAVLMTQPIELLFVFGFIVAIGILMDTFLIRGVLLPGMLVLLEKDDKPKEN